jgi:hypothetical protein
MTIQVEVLKFLTSLYWLGEYGQPLEDWAELADSIGVEEVSISQIRFEFVKIRFVEVLLCAAGDGAGRAQERRPLPLPPAGAGGPVTPFLESYFLPLNHCAFKFSSGRWSAVMELFVKTSLHNQL